MRTFSALTMLSTSLTLCACGKPQPAASNPSAPATAATSNEPVASKVAPAAPPITTEVKQVDASGFTLGEYLPPLDGGKIEIAVPEGWKPLPRDSKYVVRFANLESGSGLPRIDVTVEESDLGGLTNITKDNLVDFTIAVAKHLDEEGTAVIEPPLPMMIGSVSCARYVSHLKLKIGDGTLLVERQTLTLLHAGRLYQINLLAEVGKLVESRDAAYALCAGIRFPAGE